VLNVIFGFLTPHAISCTNGLMQELMCFFVSNEGSQHG